MPDIQASFDPKPRPALYVPQGRPQVRTKNPMRPDWMDVIKRPILVIALNAKQFDRFLMYWRFDRSECAHVLLVNDIRGVAMSKPMIVLPGSREWSAISIPDFCPLHYWESHGGLTIDIPERAMETPHQFSIEVNMAASTKIAIAQHRHLDGLNRR